MVDEAEGEDPKQPPAPDAVPSAVSSSDAAPAAKHRRTSLAATTAGAPAASAAVDVGDSDSECAALRAAAAEQRRTGLAMDWPTDPPTYRNWVPAYWMKLCRHCCISGCRHPYSMLLRGHCICVSCPCKYPPPGQVQAPGEAARLLHETLRQETSPQ